MARKLIDISHISKSYGDNLVLDDLNLYINENKFLTLLGPKAAAERLHCSVSWEDLRLRTTGELFLTERISPTLPQINASLIRYFKNTHCFPICLLLMILHLD